MAWDLRKQLLDYAPRWIKGALGTQLRAIVSSFGEELDDVAFHLRWAFKCYFISRCPEDLLSRWGAERLLPQFPGETLTQYRARLIAAPSFYRKLGTSPAIVESLALLGFQAEVICEKDWQTEIWDLPDGAWDEPFGIWDQGTPPEGWGFWNRFWVKIPLDTDVELWDAPSSTWNEEEQIWDLVGLTPQQLTQMTKLVLRAKACYNIFVAFIFVMPNGREVLYPVGEEGEQYSA